eukprot:TRINITY_DN752_c2_g1_i1.p1 TRINITY_DN752_c2_g1~~TRINITY_DN752_c2_g1_i1.p1  ORF type:complete len:3403 (+),score=1100.19 TRINITY_DN752_c2_g1_i1:167-10375(+)
MTEPFFTPTPSSRKTKSLKEEEKEVHDASYSSHSTSPMDPSYHDDTYHTTSSHADDTEMESVLPPVDATKQVVVRYMNEETLRRLAHLPFGADVSRVRTLDGRLSQAEKFKKMENLHIFSGLLKLELPNHHISKIESLDTLGRLEELNLSGNSIKEIKNVFHLRSLRILDLSHNSIVDIPMEIQSLSALQIFHVSHNRIHSLRSFARLRSNESLSHLSVLGNPCCKSEHWKLFMIYHLRQLDGIDGDAVTALERQEAIERFERDDVARLSNDIEIRDAKIRKLEEDLASHKKRESRIKKTLTQETDEKQLLTRKVRGLETQLSTQGALLDQKTKEFQSLLHENADLYEQIEQLKSEMYDERRRSGIHMLPPLGDHGDALSPVQDGTPQRRRSHHDAHERNESPFLPFAMHSQSPTSRDDVAHDSDVRKSLEKELSGLHADMGKLESELQKETELQRLTEERSKRINDRRFTESKIMDEIMTLQQRIRFSENRIALTRSPSSSPPHTQDDDDMSSEEIAKMKEENENSKKKLAALEEQHRAIAEEIHNLTVENERLRIAGEKIASRRPALEHREKRLTERVKELETLLQEKDHTVASLSESRWVESEKSFENGQKAAFVEVISAFHANVSFNEVIRTRDDEQDLEAVSAEDTRSSFTNLLDQLSTYVARLRIDLDAALHDASQELKDRIEEEEEKEEHHVDHAASIHASSQTDQQLPIPTVDRHSHAEQKELISSLEKKNRDLALKVDDDRRVISSKDAMLHEFKRRCEKLQKRLDDCEKEKSSLNTPDQVDESVIEGTSDSFVHSFNAKTLREAKELRTQVRNLTEENQLIASKNRELEEELSSLRRDHFVSMREKDNCIQSLQEKCEALRMQVEDVKSEMALRVDEPTTEEMLANLSDEDDSAFALDEDEDEDESSKLRQLHLHDIPFSHEEIGGAERSNIVHLQNRARLLMSTIHTLRRNLLFLRHSVVSTSDQLKESTFDASSLISDRLKNLQPEGHPSHREEELENLFKKSCEIVGVSTVKEVLSCFEMIPTFLEKAKRLAGLDEDELPSRSSFSRYLQTIVNRLDEHIQAKAEQLGEVERWLHQSELTKSSVQGEIESLTEQRNDLLRDLDAMKKVLETLKLEERKKSTDSEAPADVEGRSSKSAVEMPTKELVDVSCEASFESPELKALRARNRQLETQIQESRKEYEKLRSGMISLDAKRSSLEEMTSRLNDEVERIERDREALRSDLSIMESHAEDAKKKCTRLEEELTAVRASLSSSLENVKRQEDEIQKLKTASKPSDHSVIAEKTILESTSQTKDSKEKDQRIKHLQESLEESKKSLEEANQKVIDFAELNQILKDEMKELIVALENQAIPEPASDDVGTLQNEMRNARDENERLKKDLLDAKAVCDESRAENDRLSSRITELESIISASKSAMEEMKREVERPTESPKTTSDPEKRRIQARITELEHQLEEAKKSGIESQKVLAEYDKLNRTLKTEMTELVAALEASMTSQSISQEESQAFKKEIDRTRVENARLSEENDELRKRCEKTSSVSELESKTADSTNGFTEDREKMQKRIEELQKCLEEAQRSLDEAYQQTAEYNKLNQTLKAEMTELVTVLEEKLGESSSTHADSEGLKDRIVDLCDQNDQLNKDLTAIKSEREAMKADHQRMTVENASLKKMIDKVTLDGEEKDKAWKERIESAQAKSETISKRVIELERSLEESKQLQRDAEKSVAEYASVNETLKDELKELICAMEAQSNASSVSESTQVSKLRDELTIVLTDNERVKNELAALESLKDKHEKECSRLAAVVTEFEKTRIEDERSLAEYVNLNKTLKDDMNALVVSLEEKITKEEQSDIEIGKLRADNTELMSRLKIAESKINGLQSAKGAAEKEMSTLLTQLNEMRDYLHSLELKAEEEKKTAVSSSPSSSAHRESEKKIEFEISDLKRRLDDAESKNKDLREERDALQGLNKTLKEELKNLVGTLEETQRFAEEAVSSSQQQKESSENIEELHGKTERLEAKVASSSEDIARLTDENKVIKELLDKSQMAGKEMNKQLETATARNSTLEIELLKREEEITHIEQEIRERDDLIATFKSELKNLVVEYEAAQQRSEKSDLAAREAASRAETLSRELENSQSNLKETQLQLTETLESVELLRTSKEGLQEEIKVLLEHNEQEASAQSIREEQFEKEKRILEKDNQELRNASQKLQMEISQLHQQQSESSPDRVNEMNTEIERLTFENQTLKTELRGLLEIVEKEEPSAGQHAMISRELDSCKQKLSNAVSERQQQTTETMVFLSLLHIQTEEAMDKLSDLSASLPHETRLLKSRETLRTLSENMDRLHAILTGVVKDTERQEDFSAKSRLRSEIKLLTDEVEEKWKEVKLLRERVDRRKEEIGILESQYSLLGSAMDRPTTSAHSDRSMLRDAESSRRISHDISRFGEDDALLRDLSFVDEHDYRLDESIFRAAGAQDLHNPIVAKKQYEILTKQCENLERHRIVMERDLATLDSMVREKKSILANIEEPLDSGGRLHFHVDDLETMREEFVRLKETIKSELEALDATRTKRDELEKEVAYLEQRGRDAAGNISLSSSHIGLSSSSYVHKSPPSSHVDCETQTSIDAREMEFLDRMHHLPPHLEGQLEAKRVLQRRVEEVSHALQRQEEYLKSRQVEIEAEKETLVRYGKLKDRLMREDPSFRGAVEAGYSHWRHDLSGFSTERRDGGGSFEESLLLFFSIVGIEEEDWPKIRRAPFAAAQRHTAEIQRRMRDLSSEIVTQKVKIDDLAERNGESYKRIEELEKQIEELLSIEKVFSTLSLEKPTIVVDSVRQRFALLQRECKSLRNELESVREAKKTATRQIREMYETKEMALVRSNGMLNEEIMRRDAEWREHYDTLMQALETLRKQGVEFDSSKEEFLRHLRTIQVQSVESLRKLQETRMREMKDSDWREAVATRDRQLQHLIEEISALKKRITQFSDLHVADVRLIDTLLDQLRSAYVGQVSSNPEDQNIIAQVPCISAEQYSCPSTEPPSPGMDSVLVQQISVIEKLAETLRSKEIVSNTLESYGARRDRISSTSLPSASAISPVVFDPATPFPSSAFSSSRKSVATPAKRESGPHLSATMGGRMQSIPSSFSPSRISGKKAGGGRTGFVLESRMICDIQPSETSSHLLPSQERSVPVRVHHHYPHSYHQPQTQQTPFSVSLKRSTPSSTTSSSKRIPSTKTPSSTISHGHLGGHRDVSVSMLNAWAREGDDIIHLYTNLIHQLEMEGSHVELTHEKKTPILRRMHELERLLISSPVVTSGSFRRDRMDRTDDDEETPTSIPSSFITPSRSLVYRDLVAELSEQKKKLENVLNMLRRAQKSMPYLGKAPSAVRDEQRLLQVERDRLLTTIKRLSVKLRAIQHDS